MNVGRWLYKRSLVSPSRAAILSEDDKLSYARLNRRVNRLCCSLLAEGLQPGDRIGVLSRNCPEFLEVYYTCSKTGLVFVPLNFRLAPPELAHQLQDSGLRLLFCHRDLRPLVQKAFRILTGELPMCVEWGPGEAGDQVHYQTFIRGAEDPEEPEARVGLEAPQMIMYTSGTTGTPKGALLSHRKTLYNTLNALIYFDLCSRDVMLLVLPLFHSGGLNIMAVPTLYVGGTVVLRSRFDPEAFLHDVEIHRVTQAMVVPTMVNTLLKETRPESFDLSSLRSVLVGGEPISAQLMHEAQDRGLPVRQIFGQTETSIQLWMPESKAREKAGSVGLPVLHGEVRVVDEEGKPVNPGQIGEIVVGGPIQMTAYWNLPQETEQTIRDGWLHTHDLGRIDEDGFVYAVDRKGDMYVSGGENVYPAEVEKILLGHPKVLEAAIIGIPNERWGMVGHAFVRPRARETIDYPEMKVYLSDRVASYKIPKSLEILEEFPKTASGKIKKSELARHRSRS